MKLVRYGRRGEEQPGILDGKGQIRALSGVIADIDGAALSPDTLSHLRTLSVGELPVVEGNPRLGPCVAGFSKFICIGLNYHDHAAEMGLAIPEYPITFLKANSAAAGAYDNIMLPTVDGAPSVTTDWEVELGVVIGTAAKDVSVDAALSHVAGYCIANDLSERTLQLERGGQWTKGKSCDGFGPLGPWLVTADEVGDPQTLDLYTDVNGRRMQEGNSKTMIFSVAEIIAHLSSCFTLLPGDVIATGTPPGVGGGQKPEPIFLAPGDTLELGITGLGQQKMQVVAG